MVDEMAEVDGNVSLDARRTSRPKEADSRPWLKPPDLRPAAADRGASARDESPLPSDGSSAWHREKRSRRLRPFHRPFMRPALQRRGSPIAPRECVDENRAR